MGDGIRSLRSGNECTLYPGFTLRLHDRYVSHCSVLLGETSGKIPDVDEGLQTKINIAQDFWCHLKCSLVCYFFPKSTCTYDCTHASEILACLSPLILWFYILSYNWPNNFGLLLWLIVAVLYTAPSRSAIINISPVSGIFRLSYICLLVFLFFLQNWKRWIHPDWWRSCSTWTV